MSDTANAVLTPADATMPCCGRDANEPGQVRIIGWALIPEEVHCDCGVRWKIIEGAEFGGMNPEGVTIARLLCSCGGRRWVDDENWSPPFATARPYVRIPHDGLIPCGFCNEGGWNTPVGGGS